MALPAHAMVSMKVDSHFCMMEEVIHKIHSHVTTKLNPTYNWVNVTARQETKMKP